MRHGIHAARGYRYARGPFPLAREQATRNGSRVERRGSDTIASCAESAGRDQLASELGGELYEHAARPVRERLTACGAPLPRTVPRPRRVHGTRPETLASDRGVPFPNDANRYRAHSPDSIRAK